MARHDNDARPAVTTRGYAAAAMVGQPCSWCGVEVRDDEGFRAAEPAGERRAVFCRLEHIVPWAIQGAHWEPGTVLRPGDSRDVFTRDTMILNVQPLLTFANRSPDRCWTALAPEGTSPRSSTFTA